MSNIHGLHNSRKDDSDEEDENNRFVGGIGDRGGGRYGATSERLASHHTSAASKSIHSQLTAVLFLCSGLAVRPNVDESGGSNPESIFQLAENATSEDREQVRRTITMVRILQTMAQCAHLDRLTYSLTLDYFFYQYRDGFVVDDGPYRRLDDQANAEFLRALAMGKTPRELMEEGGRDVVVGLVDRRKEEYVEQFRSFSGQGTSLGTSGAAAAEGGDSGIFDPSALAQTPPAVSSDAPTTAIQVRLLNGQRQVLRLNLDMTVGDLASHASSASASDASFRMVSGFPPQPLKDPGATIEAAGLKGSQVSMQKV